MRLHPGYIACISVLLVCVVGLTDAVYAQQASGPDVGVPLPLIPRGRGENCVEDSDFMRRNHMDLLNHQRDETVVNGVRSKQFSLKECINCHAVYGVDALPVSAASPQHFCRSCHDYAAVSIDCFQCHASRPESDEFPIGLQFSGNSSESESMSGSR